MCSHSLNIMLDTVVVFLLCIVDIIIKWILLLHVLSLHALTPTIRSHLPIQTSLHRWRISSYVAETEWSVFFKLIDGTTRYNLGWVNSWTWCINGLTSAAFWLPVSFQNSCSLDLNEFTYWASKTVYRSFFHLFSEEKKRLDIQSADTHTVSINDRLQSWSYSGMLNSCYITTHSQTPIFCIVSTVDINGI